MLQNEDQIALHAFATGELIIDPAGEGRTLVDLARRLWASGPKPLTAEAAARWRYCTTALALDAEGLEEASADARLVAGILVPLALAKRIPQILARRRRSSHLTAGRVTSQTP